MDKIFENMNKNDLNLSVYATKNNVAYRFRSEEKDIRSSFFRDIDRIIYSLSYTRYIDKTQVFSNTANDNISKRMTHVQMVSKIARTIGRALNLNEDLIEAIALGHDLGHVPFGHTGEAILNRLSVEYTGRMFNHNVHSVRTLMDIENNGKGSNITLQVLDGILCHNGEFIVDQYYPVDRTPEQFLDLYEQCYTDSAVLKTLRPMTLEGCVVRISDIIGYIGRDIEDAIELGLFRRDELPKEITDVLGNTNSQIMNTVILDIIENSLDKPYIALSDKVYHALFSLKKFNGEHIYSKSMSAKDIAYYREGMNKIYHLYLNDIQGKNTSSIIYRLFLDSQSSRYLSSTSDKRMVIDFIAGMTDDMFIREIKRAR